jgi:hypothetical protein
VPRLLAEMERVEHFETDMKDRILPLWSSPHDLFPDVSAVLQQWHAAQPDMRAFFTSPAYLEVRALSKKYAKLERMADAMCQLMDLERWINDTENLICMRTENQMVFVHKQRALQQLVTVVSHDCHDCDVRHDVQSFVDRLLSKTRAKLAVQQSCVRTLLDHLASSDVDRAEIASLDWTSKAHQKLYNARWSQMRITHNALLVLVDIRKAVSWYDKLQARFRDAIVPRTG